MDKILTWNIRGLNKPHKQKEVRNFLLHENVGLVCLLEKKVNNNNFRNVHNGVFQGWCLTTNFQFHKGGRIIVAWLDTSFHVDVKFVSSQCIHKHIHYLPQNKHFHFTAIYAFNDAKGRLQLWSDLKNIHHSIDGAWMVAGDFNCPLNYDDRIGSEVTFQEVKDFRDMIEACDLTDMKCSGPRYTWNNKQYGVKRIMSKIDRCLVNEEWIDLFAAAHTVFHNEGLFDHCPAVIHMDSTMARGKVSFKFSNMWIQNSEFHALVQRCWQTDVKGSLMFKVVRKLKLMKASLKELHKNNYSYVQQQLLCAKQELTNSQNMHHKFPADPIISSYEGEVTRNYDQVRKAYETDIIQKAKISWLQYGDENSSIFHKALKVRKYQQSFLELKDMNGIPRKGFGNITNAFEEYYKLLLGSGVVEREKVQLDVVRMGPILQNHHRLLLQAPITDEEIKKAMFSIPGSKSPGPDGYNSSFFKATWEVTGSEICEAIKDFFCSGKILKEINCTRISLIPKVSLPCSVTDFRPIACCNTFYKCITKIICNRLKLVLPDLISDNQSGFIKGRQIIHNVSIIQDLVGMYNRKSTPPSCLLKIDIRKAYDSVCWEFLDEMLHAFGFPDNVIGWIMACVTTPYFSLSFNGASYGFFKGKKGLHQGDPMSPLLFVI
ncbi:LINE-1 retrotransposable element ORF2 protein [Bienertia sinuspersici]